MPIGKYEWNDKRQQSTCYKQLPNYPVLISQLTFRYRKVSTSQLITENIKSIVYRKCQIILKSCFLANPKIGKSTYLHVNIWRCCRWCRNGCFVFCSWFFCHVQSKNINSVHNLVNIEILNDLTKKVGMYCSLKTSYKCCSRQQ